MPTRRAADGVALKFGVSPTDRCIEDEVMRKVGQRHDTLLEEQQALRKNTATTGIHSSAYVR